MLLVRHPMVFIFLSLFDFARVSSHVDDFNTRSKVLTSERLHDCGQIRSYKLVRLLIAVVSYQWTNNLCHKLMRLHNCCLRQILWVS